MSASGRKLLRRDERRSQLVRAAVSAFARNGFAATGLDDVAEQAGVTKVLIYRHFASKSELYLAALDDVRDRIRERTGRPEDYDVGTVRALILAAQDDPDGFCLLFRHAAREPEVAGYADGLAKDATHITTLHLFGGLRPTPRQRWLAGLHHLITIELILSWLDAGGPVEPDELATIIGTTLSAITP